MTSKQMAKRSASVAAVNESGQILEVLSRAAADPNTDIEKLERLMGLYERISAKQAEQQFNEAFAAMQPELPAIEKSGKIVVRGTTQSHYAKNEDIQEAVKPILAKCGFSLNFKNADNQETGTYGMTGKLAHVGGHFETDTFSAPADTSGNKNALQAIASTRQYAMRYVTVALLNIVTRGADKDGQLPGTPITEEQAADLLALITETGANQAAFCNHFGCDTLENLDAKLYGQALTLLKAKQRGGK